MNLKASSTRDGNNNFSFEILSHFGVGGGEEGPENQSTKVPTTVHWHLLLVLHAVCIKSALFFLKCDTRGYLSRVHSTTFELRERELWSTLSFTQPLSHWRSTQAGSLSVPLNGWLFRSLNKYEKKKNNNRRNVWMWQSLCSSSYWLVVAIQVLFFLITVFPMLN